MRKSGEGFVLRGLPGWDGYDRVAELRACSQKVSTQTTKYKSVMQLLASLQFLEVNLPVLLDGVFNAVDNFSPEMEICTNRVTYPFPT